MSLPDFIWTKLGFLGEAVPRINNTKILYGNVTIMGFIDLYTLHIFSYKVECLKSVLDVKGWKIKLLNCQKCNFEENYITSMYMWNC